MVSSAVAQVPGAPSGAGKLGDEHEHASLLVRIFSDKFDFSSPHYQIKSSWIHFEDSDGNTIHRHSSGVDLGYLFDTLNISINSECYIFPDGRLFCTNDDYSLKYYINHQPVSGINDYVIKDGDRILITFGNETPEQIEKQLLELDSQIGTSHNFLYPPTIEDEPVSVTEDSTEEVSDTGYAMVTIFIFIIPIAAVIIIVILIKKMRQKNKEIKTADVRFDKQKKHLAKMVQSTTKPPQQEPSSKSVDTKEDSLLCENCGNPLIPKDKFCHKCGSEVN